MSDDFELPLATKKSLAIPPALVEAVQEDPSLIAQISRSQLLVVQDMMVRKLMSNPDVTPAQLAAAHERLTKTAQLDPKDAENGRGTGFSIVINLSGSQAAPPAIDVTPTK
jgi:hypothetical protein